MRYGRHLERFNIRLIPDAARLALIALMLPLTAVAASISTTFFTAGEVYDNCSLDVNRAECRSYVMGISDVMGGNTIYGWRACIPLGTAGEALLSVAMDYVRRHPEERTGSSASVIAKALSQGFPCP
jgi:hypothetical protein